LGSLLPGALKITLGLINVSAVDFLCELGRRISKFREEWQTAYLFQWLSLCSDLMQLSYTTAYHQVRTSGTGHQWI